MSDSTFTLRLDSSLKEAFTTAAKLQDRSCAQLIRDFIRDFVRSSHNQESYEQWFVRKIEESRSDARQGRVVDNDVVRAEAMERREQLLARIGGRQ